ncbi:hypothetical protein CARUB_v10001223mg [Capsella rubella]|uniref:Protein BYPASS-related protein n=1 Tax=Capsella rubella TaxID=81985 RepID=R0HB74_9BRAS|nr:uncharacterized protein LOC17881822 [Capsella rubella]EOA20888.1 hypothetical protein CARUB_v10001223mg [Capsella rubella]
MAPVTEHQSSFLSRISRRNQIVSMDVNHEQELEELEDFQKHVAERFSELLPSDSPESFPVLSIQWLRKLLDVFQSIETEFHSVLTTNPSQISKPPLDKLVPEMLDRIVKALDICTAVVNGVDSVRQIQRLAEIAVTALKQTPLSDGSVRRAKRALSSLLAALNADKISGSGGGSGRRSTSEQWSSFSRRSGGSGSGGGCVSKNWSAAKQIQAMTTNLVAPRGGESSPIYIMSSVMVTVMWTLVAAVPCQTSNGLAVHLPLPKNQIWASAAVSISERIGEEMKKKETRCGGLMEEMQRMERIGLKLMEFSEGFRFNGEEDVTAEVAEMEEICRKMGDGLEGLQRRVREVFHRLVKSRSEILEVIDQHH